MPDDTPRELGDGRGRAAGDEFGDEPVEDRRSDVATAIGIVVVRHGAVVASK